MSGRARIAAATGAAVLVLAAGAVPLLDRIATRRYERRLVQAVRQRYGGELTLTGFKVSVVGSSARVTAFRYEDPAAANYRVVVTGGKVVADIEGLSLDPEVVRFKEIVLHQPVLSVVRTPQGDWDKGIPGLARDLVSAGIDRAKKALGLEKVKVTAGGEPGKTLRLEKAERRLEIGRLSIRDASVTYEDRRFTHLPIRLTLRDFDFEGRELSGSDLWRSILTSEADGTLALGAQEVKFKGVTRPVEGQDKKVWSLEAQGIDLAPLLGPVLRPLLLDVQGGKLDVRLSHLFDVRLAERSSILVDYDLRSSGVVLALRDATGARALLRSAAERVKAFVDEREGKVELQFSVELAPDTALFGKEAGNTLEVLGRLTLEALHKKLLQSMGLSSLVE